MPSRCDKLDGEHLNIMPANHDGVLEEDVKKIGADEIQLVTGLDGSVDLVSQLEAYAQCAQAGKPRTLDLIAHSVPDGRYLRLGSSLINTTDQKVRQAFGDIASSGLLAKLAVTQVRLIGCCTAVSQRGQTTIRDLESILGCSVAGTTVDIHAAHFGPGGLQQKYDKFVIATPQTMKAPTEWVHWYESVPSPRSLLLPAPPFDVGGLPSWPMESLGPIKWPVVTLGPEVEPAIVNLIDPNNGLNVPGLLTEPLIEILLAAGVGRVRRVQVLFNWDFVRVRPGDNGADGVYPVRSPDELKKLIGAAPIFHTPLVSDR